MQFRTLTVVGQAMLMWFVILVAFTCLGRAAETKAGIQGLIVFNDGNHTGEYATAVEYTLFESFGSTFKVEAPGGRTVSGFTSHIVANIKYSDVSAAQLAKMERAAKENMNARPLLKRRILSLKEALANPPPPPPPPAPKMAPPVARLMPGEARNEDRFVPSMTAGKKTFFNVRPLLMVRGQIKFSHADGIASVPVADLTQSALRACAVARPEIKDDEAYQQAIAQFIPSVTVAGKVYLGVKLISNKEGSLVLMTDAGLVSCQWSELSDIDQTCLGGAGPGLKTKEPAKMAGAAEPAETPLTPEQLKQRFETFLRDAEAGDAAAMGGLGFCYFNGDGVGKDDMNAVSWFQKGAARGDARALFGLGRCHDTKCGVDRDRAKAAEYYQKAVNAGSAAACFYLGNCYGEGLGRPKNAVKAVEVFERGAQAGDGNCLCMLGLYLESGIGGEQNPAKAAEYLQRAVQRGGEALSSSMAALGSLYETGRGVNESQTTAIEWYEKAAALGNDVAMMSLGNICLKDKMSEKAVEWFTRAVKAGSVGANNMLGYCHENGLGVEADAEQAVASYKRGANGGDSFAMCNLGRCYRRGIGTAQNSSEAERMLKLSSDKGCAAAREELRSQGFEQQDFSLPLFLLSTFLSMASSNASQPDDGWGPARMANNMRLEVGLPGLRGFSSVPAR